MTSAGPPTRTRTDDSRRFGLRARLIAAFGLLGLILSLILSSATYLFAQNSLVNRTQEVALDRANQNAAEVSRRSRALDDEEQARLLVEQVFTPEGSAALFQVRDGFFGSSSIGFGEEDIDEGLRIAVEQGLAVQMLADIRGETSYLIGIPLKQVGFRAAYYEETSLSGVEDTLNSLRLALLAGSVLSTVAGVGLGFYAGRTVLSPLSTISAAATKIASGDLDTRLSADPDRDLQQLSHSFNEMATALQDRIERDARFASDVSHELRSPLMTLTASIAVLERRRDDLPERSRVAVDLLSADINRFTHLVEDLLEISRFDVGAADLDRQPLEAGEFVRQALKMVGSPNVPVRAPDIDLFINGDKRRLLQIMQNLIDNAAKYGSGATGVEISRAAPEGFGNPMVQISVIDEGSGVPDAEQDVIFDRFARGSEGGRRGSSTGTGLGLALAKEHVMLHGGRIWVENRSGGSTGARFSFTIPEYTP